jgi:hypothetical protein
MHTVKWATCGNDGHWCSLDLLNLEPLGHTGGVYAIWHEGNPSRIVRVGQGNIADRLAAHRRDPKIAAYRAFGTLRVTWAVLPEWMWDGVERYLAEYLQPLVGDAFPDVLPIAVNW